jgi:ribokinase
VLLGSGEEGVAARSAGHTLRLPSHAVPVLDTTGAGDTFAAVLAAASCEGHGLCEASSRAVVAAAPACARSGARRAQPTRLEVDRELALHAAR